MVRVRVGAPERRFGHRNFTHSTVGVALPSRIDQTRPYYLLGEVELADARAQARIAILSSIETYNPASYRGGILTLHYARAREEAEWVIRLSRYAY